jgi:hypothetical protein
MWNGAEALRTEGCMPSRGDLYGIVEMKRRFGRGDVTLDRIVGHYREREPEISRTTVRWRLTVLRSAGVVTAVARGVYRLERSRDFLPRPTTPIREAAGILDGILPEDSKYCVWTTSWIRRFAGRGTLPPILVAQVPRESLAMASTALRVRGFAGIVEPYVVGSPMRRTFRVPMPKLEKLVVDAYCLFARDGGEAAGVAGPSAAAARSAVAEAIGVAVRTCGINRSTTLRYARNRGVREEMERLLDAAAEVERIRSAAAGRAWGGTP